jgi:hypothetical protein
MWHVRVTKLHTGFWRGDVSERTYLEDLGLDERMILKWIFNK